MTLALGCIADDLTGATDLASMLVRNGMNTVQFIGVPDAAGCVPAQATGQTPVPQAAQTPAPRRAALRPRVETQAAIIAIKSRTAPVSEATGQSLRALRWLRECGARQFFFKYCSTFDSTDRGNIGPVIDALLDALGEDFTICCPAFPANGRTVYQGHLFVGDTLLAESPMRHHPLTPMTDSSLVRLLQRQARGRVGLIPCPVVDAGPEAIRSAIDQARAAGHRYAVIDALNNQHLLAIGQACAGLALVTGGSGVAMGLPENFRRQGLMPGGSGAASLPPAAGLAAVIAGSCSPATLAQVEAMREDHPAFQVDPHALAAGTDVASQAIAWAAARLARGPVLIYSSAPPESVARTQQALGQERAGQLVERALAAIACGLVAAGVRRLVVAGGETAGAVLHAMGITRLEIGLEIEPGVPWTHHPGNPPLWLALKSGNFGGRDFFAQAFARLS